MFTLYEQPEEEAAALRSDGKQATSSDGRVFVFPKSTTSFLIKTYLILESPDTQHIVSWDWETYGKGGRPLGSGKKRRGTRRNASDDESQRLMKDENGEYLDYSDAVNPCRLVIHDIGAFEREVLSNTFKHSRFSSFVRQLNSYGFHKVETSTFSHPMFRRQDLHSIGRIKRKTASARNRKKRKVPPADMALETQDGEVDFREMNARSTISSQHSRSTRAGSVGQSKKRQRTNGDNEGTEWAGNDALADILGENSIKPDVLQVYHGGNRVTQHPVATQNGSKSSGATSDNGASSASRASSDTMNTMSENHMHELMLLKTERDMILGQMKAMQMEMHAQQSALKMMEQELHKTQVVAQKYAMVVRRMQGGGAEVASDGSVDDMIAGGMGKGKGLPGIRQARLLGLGKKLPSPNMGYKSISTVRTGNSNSTGTSEVGSDMSYTMLDGSYSSASSGRSQGSKSTDDSNSDSSSRTSSRSRSRSRTSGSSGSSHHHRNSSSGGRKHHSSRSRRSKRRNGGKGDWETEESKGRSSTRRQSPSSEGSQGSSGSSSGSSGGSTGQESSNSGTSSEKSMGGVFSMLATPVGVDQSVTELFGQSGLALGLEGTNRALSVDSNGTDDRLQSPRTRPPGTQLDSDPVNAQLLMGWNPVG